MIGSLGLGFLYNLIWCLMSQGLALWILICSMFVRIFFWIWNCGPVQVGPKYGAGQASREMFQFMLIVSFSTFWKHVTIFCKLRVYFISFPCKDIQTPKAAYIISPRVENQGDQFISPFVWALENGSETICTAMLKDLLIIRADRAKYYYGAEDTERYNTCQWNKKVTVMLVGFFDSQMDGCWWFFSDEVLVNYDWDWFLVGIGGPAAFFVDPFGQIISEESFDCKAATWRLFCIQVDVTCMFLDVHISSYIHRFFCDVQFSSIWCYKSLLHFYLPCPNFLFPTKKAEKHYPKRTPT